MCVGAPHRLIPFHSVTWPMDAEGVPTRVFISREAFRPLGDWMGSSWSRPGSDSIKGPY